VTHTPRVVIATTPNIDRLVVGHNTRVTVDGQEWPVRAYLVEGTVEQPQEVTLTFLADVTITHPEDAA
jgi:hypothetical protein